MTKLIQIVVVSGALLFASAVVRPKYQHFDDYLNSLKTGDQNWLSETSQENDSTTLDSNSAEDSTSIPLNHELTCCLLGQLAGDKGYHCYVQYYAARLVLRNRNRAHNRKMPFYGPEKIEHYGEKVMTTFEQCLAGMGPVFHKCCRIAYSETVPKFRYDTVQRIKYQQNHRTRKNQRKNGDFLN